MRPNRVRELAAAGRTAVAGWMSFDSAYAAEIAGTSGFDAVVIDCQDGMADHAQMLAMRQALSRTPATPIVRVAANQYLYRAVDKLGPTVDFVPTSHRDVAAARRFFQLAMDLRERLIT